MKPEPLITVRSVNDSAKFYCQLLGAQRGHEGDNYAQILLDGEMIMQIHDFDSDPNHEPLGDASLPLGNGVVLWFETDDVESLETRIEEFGIKLDREPFENEFAKQTEFWLHDPDGYQVVVAGPSPWPRVPVDS